MPTARLTRRYLTALASADENARWVAAMKLTHRGGWRVRVALEGIAQHHPSPVAREAAAWTLGFRGDTRAARTLANLVADGHEETRVRSHAAEALGHLLPFRVAGQAVEDAIRNGLDDPSPDVRFWCIFAAATIPVSAAASRIRVLATEDHAEIDGWWPVATEAEWALRKLAGDPNADELLPGAPVLGGHS